jgi:hypothetical protein
MSWRLWGLLDGVDLVVECVCVCWREVTHVISVAVVCLKDVLLLRLMLDADDEGKGEQYLTGK